MKYHCYQVPPEYQESPLIWGDCIADEIAVTGNPDFADLLPANVESVKNYITRNYWVDADEITGYLITYGVKPEHKKKFSALDIARIYKIKNAESRGDMPENDAITEIMGIVTGESWDLCTIRGCCQSDWAIAIYPARLADYVAGEFETAFFNMGTEWTIDPETVDAVNIYAYTMDPAREIAEFMTYETGENITPDNIVLHWFAGWKKTPVYD